ncbi:MAG: DUF4286 family protein [Bacteroidota bacterium]|nr:DUF4286 family protein [Bacteroidota bacterium]
MIIYNVTTKVEHTVAAAWLNWLTAEHIPAIIATGCFTHATVLHLLEVDDPEGVTYAVQYHAADKLLYDRYLQQFAGEMRAKAMDKWGNKFIAFRSIMEVVH